MRVIYVSTIEEFYLYSQFFNFDLKFVINESKNFIGKFFFSASRM